MPRNSKSELDVYPEVHVQLIPENASVEAKSSSSTSISLEKRKKQAEEPMYLKRL